LKPRKYQYLQIKAGYGSRGNGSTRIKVWACRYVGCNRILNDVDYSFPSKFCKFHVAIRVKENYRRCYVNRVGKVKEFEKNKMLLYLLKNNTKVSKYQILAYTKIKNMDSLRSQLTFLRRQGHKITRRMEMYWLEKE